MKKSLLILLAIILILMSGCAQKADEDNAEQSYAQITQDEAKEMMAKDDGHVIVDVRSQDEYDAGHIPGAILIPNESIGTEQPKELPDLDQIILVYCRSGNRSKQASQKLADMGYTYVDEFGGINDWTGEIVTGESDAQEIWTDTEMPVRLRYDRMWEYSDYAETSDPVMIAEIVDAVKPVPTLVIEANDHIFYADPEDNSSADALIEKLSTGEIELELHDYGSFEKVGPLPWDLPHNDEIHHDRAGRRDPLSGKSDYDLL